MKGGPRQYEAIFVGYDENCIGWYVRDLKGTCHFSRDIIFNESVPSHLSPPCHSVIPASMNSTSHRPVHSRVHTAGGQAFADLIHARNVALASRRSNKALPDGGASFFSLSDILDFVSLVDYNFFSDSFFYSSLDLISFPSFLSFDFASLSFFSANPSRFLRTLSSFSTTDLLKPPESFHEACSCPDVSVW